MALSAARRGLGTAGVVAVVVASAGAAAAACGTQADPAHSTPAPSDGVGHFGEALPVELCLGATRVVAPGVSTGAGAVCVRDDATAKPCSSDSECAGIERCACGRCAVRPCQGASGCGEGRTCRGKRCTLACTGDAECGAGSACVTGGCARRCKTDDECHFGEYCDGLDHACAARLCSDVVKCGAGDRCEATEIVGDVREPDFAHTRDDGIAFVEIRDVQRRAIYRVQIDAPERWHADPVEPVVASADAGGVGAPAALVARADDGGLGRIDLWFEVGDGAAIGHAASDDGGRHFVVDAAPSLVPSGGWEAGRVASPAVFVLRDARYLVYEGGPRAGLGVARIEGAHATRLGDAAVASPATFEDAVFWRAVSEVGAPAAVVSGEGADAIARIFATVRGAEGRDSMTGQGPLPAEINDSIGLLASADLVRFDHAVTGPVYARVTNLRAYLGEREPTVVVDEAGADLVFVSTDARTGAPGGLFRARPR